MIPNKAFQALACGTPLVTADTPAARELLVDGESALLVPAGRSRGARRGAPAARGGAGARAEARHGRPRRLPRAGERGRPRRPLARRSWRASCDRAAAAVGRGRRLCGRLRRALDPPRPRLRDRPLRPRQHGAGGLDDRARPSARDHRACRATRSRGSAPTSTRSSSCSRRSGGSGRARTCCSPARRSPSRSGRCRCSGSRRSTSARSGPRSGSRSSTCCCPPSSG